MSTGAGGIGPHGGGSNAMSRVSTAEIGITPLCAGTPALAKQIGASLIS